MPKISKNYEEEENKPLPRKIKMTSDKKVKKMKK